MRVNVVQAKESIIPYTKIAERLRMGGSISDPEIYEYLDELSSRSKRFNIPERIEKVKEIKENFPEIEYLIGMLASITIFPSDPESLRSIPIFQVDIFPKDPEVDTDELVSDILKILENNNTEFQIYSGTQDLFYYGFCGVYFHDSDYTTMTIFSPEDMKFKKDEIELPGVKKVNKRRFILITNEKNKEFGEPRVLRCYKYLQIISNLETALFLERILKASTLTVWKIGVDDLDEEDVPSYIALFKSRVLSKVQTSPNEKGSIYAKFSKFIANQHVFVPQTQKAPVEIDTVKFDYKPILIDINYFWDKVYLSLGVPIHLRERAETLRGVPTEVITFHNTILATRIRYYQRIWEMFLEKWIEKILENRGIEVKHVRVKLPQVDLQRRETDLDKISKAVSAFFNLQSGLGLPIRTDFILKTLFPGVPIEEIVEKFESSSESDTTENPDIESYFKSLIGGTN